MRMCGIAGFNWEDKVLIKKMTDSIKHRGPDSQGQYTDKNISLGNRRLSIIDLSNNGKMPMSNEDGSIWITYNGEIYNFQEIREDLEKKGHRFKSNTDTEVIINAYEEYGEKCLQKFNGMFVFAIWDSKKKKLFCARDRLGIKPLFYYWDNKKLIFASEIKAILKTGIKRKADKKGLSYFLAYGFNPTDHSLFANIFKLMPGHYFVYKNKQLKIKRYWQLDYSKKIRRGEGYFVKKIREEFEKSVKRRLIADVPIGFFLSGGLDSSMVVAMARKHMEKVKTFSVRFNEEGFDESPYAAIVSEKFNTDHFVIDFESKDVLKNFNIMVDYFEEPIADTTIIPSYFLSKLSRKKVKLVLTGLGGDELFAGYDRYLAYKKLRLQKYVPPSFNKAVQKIAAKTASKSGMMRKLTIFSQYGGLKDYEMFGKTWHAMGITNDGDLLAKKMETVNGYYKKFFVYPSWLDNVTNSDAHNFMQADTLQMTDTTSMAASLEARVPFVDHTFVELSAKMPAHLKLRNNETKYILKKSFKGILPKKIIFRPKKGFNTPIENYFRREMKSFVEDNLFSKEFSALGLFNQRTVKEIIEKHNAGTRNNRQAILTMLLLKKWFDKWQPSLDD